MTEEKADTYIEGDGKTAPEFFETAKPHPIFAAIVDLYLIEIIFGFLASLALVFLGKNTVEVIFPVLGILSFILIVLYHAKFAKQIGWLSPGEIVGGKLLIHGAKEWVNPYNSNRFGLFFIVFVTLLEFRDSADLLGRVMTVAAITGFLLKIIMVTISIILIGKGKLRGIAIINTLLLIDFGLSAIYKSTAVHSSDYFTLALFFIFAVIGTVYYFIRKKQL